jgi:hypothetical protein
MHVKAKQMAFLGLLAAMTSVLIIFASLLESNTLFLLAAAAFLVGISIREFGIRIGIGFFAACIFLGFLLAPNKLYVMTYSALSLYIVWNEAVYRILAKLRIQKHKQIFFYLIKLAFFNILYIPMIFIFPQFLFKINISNSVYLLLIAGGQLGWFVYDKAYEYFQVIIWGKMRSKISLLH